MHSLEEAQLIADKVISKGIGKMSNKKLQMTEQQLEDANK
jgi:hypothetical protein